MPETRTCLSSSDGPFIGFSAAAGAVVHQLTQYLPTLDLWLVTTVVDDRQHVIARSGRWAEIAPVGAEFSWQASFCIRMVSGEGSPVAPNFAAEPAYQQAAVGPLAKVRAYLGVPLLIGEGELFGTLCGLGGTQQPRELAEAMPMVTLLGRMLSSVLAGERAAHRRSADAANAYALAERDPLTGLRNKRGFERAVTTEQGRGQRFGTRSSIVLVTLAAPLNVRDLHGGVGEDELRRCAEVLSSLGRAGDVAARVGGAEFALLAVEADTISARALQMCVRRALRTAQLPAWTAIATRRAGEELAETCERAHQELQVRRRRSPRLAPTRREAAS